MKKTYLILIALILITVLPLRAEEPRADKETDIKVVVTAERILQPVSESIASTTVITARQTMNW